MATGSIKIGPNYFQKELKHYSDWGMAFWRELLQNAKDGDGRRRASEIRCEYNRIEDGNAALISVADNGPGMKRAMLDSVYFVMGESGKTGTNSTGGYGMARMLTCWAQRNYSIRSQDYFVQGVGADYDVDEGRTFEHGFTIQVTADQCPLGKRQVDLMEKLKFYLSRSYFPVPVFVNGERWKNWTYARNAKRELSFGRVYTNQSKSPELIVRVDGAMMFTRPLNTACQVIVEINPLMSRDVLLVNRDGLVYEQQCELDSFVNELNINKRSALHQRNSKSTAFKGTGAFKAQRKQKQVELTDTAIMATGALLTGDALPMPVLPVREFHDRSVTSTMERIEAQLRIFDVIIEDETDNVAVRKVIDSYNPICWDLLGEKGFRLVGGKKQYFRAGVDKYKLLCLWRAACEYAIELLFDVCPTVPDSFNWGVGFVFSDTKGACHMSRDNTHHLLLNPCDEKGLMRYGISSKEDLRRILGLALHEVTHIAASYHDEDYAYILTRLVQEHDQNEAFKRMKEAKEAILTAA